MTAAQLAHLAELAASAADFFATTDHDVARVFARAALHADACSSEMRQAEEGARRHSVIGPVPAEIAHSVVL